MVLGADIAHERAVDLELVNLEPLEVVEGCVAGAVVVDGDCHAKPAQSVDHGVGAHSVGQNAGLRHLEDQGARWDVVAKQGVPHLVGEGEVGEQARREVHGHAELVALRTPLRELG